MPLKQALAICQLLLDTEIQTTESKDWRTDCQQARQKLGELKLAYNNQNTKS